MAQCHIVVCKTRATWEGEITSVQTDHSQVVKYCDGHAWIQTYTIARVEGLRIHLTPIGQRKVGT